jgi:hypothetical protein
MLNERVERSLPSPPVVRRLGAYDQSDAQPECTVSIWFSFHDAVMAEKAPRVVAGLDFGTTFSGFAWTTVINAGVGDQAFNVGQINSIDTYPDAKKLQFHYPKTATALFYETAGDANPHWGWKARLRAMDPVIAKTAKAQSWQYQFRFKLRLAGHTEHNDPNMPPLPEGCTSEDVIATYLRQMSAFALENFSKGIMGGIKMSEVKWCLTVPAQWSQPLRVAMYRAAQKAGMIKNPDEPDNGGSPFPLVIVPEPEAASVYCFNRVVNPEAVQHVFVLFYRQLFNFTHSCSGRLGSPT